MVNYSASLSASYELDFWGKNCDAAQAAEETASANRFDRDVVALTTLTTVANAYFQVLAAQDRICTAQQNIASAERILNAIRDRFKAGIGDACALRDRRVVHEHVEPAERVPRLERDLFGAVEVAEVGGPHPRVGRVLAAAVEHLFEAIGAPGDDADGRAALGEDRRERGADARRTRR